jgi:hypothetical protein
MNVDKKYHSISDTQKEHQEIQQNLILYTSSLNLRLALIILL